MKNKLILILLLCSQSYLNISAMDQLEKRLDDFDYSNVTIDLSSFKEIIKKRVIKGILKECDEGRNKHKLDLMLKLNDQIFRQAILKGFENILTEAIHLTQPEPNQEDQSSQSNCIIM